MNKYIEITVPPGKKIPTIEVYESLLLPDEIQDDYCRINQFGGVTSEDKEVLFVVQTDDNHFSLLPGPEFSPRLYRGQNNFHKECVPMLFRKPITKIRYLTDLLKKYEFYKLMAGHPIVRYLQDWCIDGKCFKTDLEGLSAHYEFATPMMDVTKSKDVAMFFALCEKNKKINRYEPITDENRKIVLYTVNLKALFENRNSDFHVIGFQALPRPDAQKAYSLFIGHNHNFNTRSFISHKIFRVNRKQSEKYFEMFEGGSKLFPNDFVDDMAWKIRQSKEIDRDVLEVCFERHLIPKVWANTAEVCKFLKEFGYKVSEKHLEFTDDAKRKIIEKWNNNPLLYIDRVKCRFVAEPK
ncbi:MAG: FRG domain-containing protein [Candidatus Scalindua sp.]